jgi:hypothetical protein
MQDAPEMLRGIIAQKYANASEGGWSAADEKGPVTRPPHCTEPDTGDRRCETTVNGDTCPVGVCEPPDDVSADRKCDTLPNTCTLDGDTCPVDVCLPKADEVTGNKNCETIPRTCTVDGDTCPVDVCVPRRYAGFSPTVAGWSSPPPLPLP